MNKPEQPPDPPDDGASPAHDPAGETPHGIPKGVDHHDAKGYPTDDRKDTEAAPT